MSTGVVHYLLTSHLPMEYFTDRLGKRHVLYKCSVQNCNKKRPSFKKFCSNCNKQVNLLDGKWVYKKDSLPVILLPL